jgi:2'-5' RNA ligase
MRVFVAVVPPPEVRQKLAAFMEPLRRKHPSVKWVPTENLHLTLRFFGEIDDDDARRVGELTQQVSMLTAPFKVRLAGAGQFPPRGRPHVYWVGVNKGLGELAELARLLERAYKGAKLGETDKPLKPHLTIGRTPHHRKGRAAQAVGKLPDLGGLTFDSGEFMVREVCVVKSELSSRGPAYTPLVVARLVS